MDQVALINPIEVTEENEIAFLEKWIEVSRRLRKLEGLISLNLYRSIDPFSRFRFAIIEQWQSEEALRKAMHTMGGAGGHHDFPCLHYPGIYRIFSH